MKLNLNRMRLYRTAGRYYKYKTFDKNIQISGVSSEEIRYDSEIFGVIQCMEEETPDPEEGLFAKTQPLFFTTASYEQLPHNTATSTVIEVPNAYTFEQDATTPYLVQFAVENHFTSAKFVKYKILRFRNFSFSKSNGWD